MRYILFFLFSFPLIVFSQTDTVGKVPRDSIRVFDPNTIEIKNVSIKQWELDSKGSHLEFGSPTINFYAGKPNVYKVATVKSNGDFEGEDENGITCYKKFDGEWVIIDTARALTSLKLAAEAMVIHFKRKE
jgi:hypothetical protein